MNRIKFKDSNWIFSLTILPCFFAFQVAAQWNSNTTINTSVVLETENQEDIDLVADRNGGCMMIWEDNRNVATNATDIYIQRLDSAGFPLWGSGGKAVCNQPALQKGASLLYSSFDRSVIICWEDKRNGNTDIYAQKMDSLGNALWPSNGILVCNKPTAQENPKLVDDNAGGAIIVWQDSVNLFWDIYAQHVDADGILQWTSTGVVVCTSGEAQINPRIEKGNSGEVIIAWQDRRNGNDNNIYAQKLNASGQVQWATNGVVVCNSSGNQRNQRIEPNGSGGVLISWEDKRNGLDYNVYAQSVSSSGAMNWAANGVLICNAANSQSEIDMKYLENNTCALAWKDGRSGSSAIYTQLINNSGQAQFTTNGQLLSSCIKASKPCLETDGNGGYFVAWQDSILNNWNIKSQWLNASGISQWSSGGKMVTDAGNVQINPAICSDGRGGAIYAWEDKRNGTNNDIYAHHFTGFTQGVIDGIRNQNFNVFPNPFTSSAMITLDGFGTMEGWWLSIVDAYGREVYSSAISGYGECWFNGESWTNGVYVYVIFSPRKGRLMQGKIVKMEP